MITTKDLDEVLLSVKNAASESDLPKGVIDSSGELAKAAKGSTQFIPFIGAIVSTSLMEFLKEAISGKCKPDETEKLYSKLAFNASVSSLIVGYQLGLREAGKTFGTERLDGDEG